MMYDWFIYNDYGEPGVYMYFAPDDFTIETTDVIVLKTGDGKLDNILVHPVTTISKYEWRQLMNSTIGWTYIGKFRTVWLLAMFQQISEALKR